MPPEQGVGRHSATTVNTTTLLQVHHALIFLGDPKGILLRLGTHFFPTIILLYC
jgi:hypothetical protein